MTTIILCRQCSGTTIIKQQKMYSYGLVNQRCCKQCGYKARYQVVDGNEVYIGDVMKLTPENIARRQMVKDTLFRLERGGKTPVWVLEALRSAGRKMGVM